MSLDEIELPACLERVNGGVRVSGHRVALFQVLDALYDGNTMDRIEEMFPTISPSKLGEVVGFCERHVESMRGYHAEQRAAFAALAGSRSGNAPTLAELRRRRTEKVGPEERR